MKLLDLAAPDCQGGRELEFADGRLHRQGIVVTREAAIALTSHHRQLHTGESDDLTEAPHDSHVLAVGDLVALSSQCQGVVAEVVESLPGGQILWPGVEAGLRAVFKLACAKLQLQARSIGSYSLVSQQPLGNEVAAGQLITQDRVFALQKQGAWMTAGELLTVKSDDVTGRMKLFESLVLGEPCSAPSLPRSAANFQRQLAAIAISVDEVQISRAASDSPNVLDIFSYSDPPPSPEPMFAIALTAAETIRETSSGQPFCSETFDESDLPVPGGLFCQRIFGPVRDYHCLCGKYAGMKHRGVVCDECGVTVTQSKTRSERFGHIDLHTHVIHPLFLETAATLLAIPTSTLKATVYEGMPLPSALADDSELSGGTAVFSALKKLDLASLAGQSNARGQIAGLLVKNGYRAEQLCFDVWPILPPDLRPCYPLSNGNWAVSDHNDPYIDLLDHSLALGELLRQGAARSLIALKERQIQLIVDALVAKGRSHLIFLPESKRVDYSGAAVAVVADGLPENRIKIPIDMAREMFRPWIYSQLETDGTFAADEVGMLKKARALVDAKDARADAALAQVIADHPIVVTREDSPNNLAPAAIASCEFECWEHPAIGISEVLAKALGATFDGSRLIAYVPVDLLALEECRAWSIASTIPPAASWLARKLCGLMVRADRCSAEAPGIETCLIEGGLCATCSGFAEGTAIGLLAAEALSPHAERLLNYWPPSQHAKSIVGLDIEPRWLAVAARLGPTGWLARACTSDDPINVLVDAALRKEIDTLDDPISRSQMGQLGWKRSFACDV